MDITDIFTPEKRLEIMSKVKGKDTSPELRLHNRNIVALII